VASQPFKIVCVAVEPTVFISLEKTLALAETLVDTSHGTLAEILKVILGPHLVLGRVVLKHLVIESTLLSKVKNEVASEDDIRQISDKETDYRSVKS